MLRAAWRALSMAKPKDVCTHEHKWCTHVHTIHTAEHSVALVMTYAGARCMPEVAAYRRAHLLTIIWRRRTLRSNKVVCTTDKAVLRSPRLRPAPEERHLCCTTHELHACQSMWHVPCARMLHRSCFYLSSPGAHTFMYATSHCGTTDGSSWQTQILINVYF